MGSRVSQSRGSPKKEVCLQIGHRSWDCQDSQADKASSGAMKDVAAVDLVDLDSHKAQPMQAER